MADELAIRVARLRTAIREGQWDTVLVQAEEIQDDTAEIQDNMRANGARSIWNREKGTTPRFDQWIRDPMGD